MPSENFAVIVPMANEEKDFYLFTDSLQKVLDKLNAGTVYLIIDKASKDQTLEFCNKLAKMDPRFVSVWSPENRHVADAYIRGYKEALSQGHQIIIEMDAGMSHDPSSLSVFIDEFKQGYDCVFGSRFINGGSMIHSPWHRKFVSKFGTWLANLLLGTNLHDMTSGYQGFRAEVVKKFVEYDFRSVAHFYQTELRYLLRKYNYKEIPITYHSTSSGISNQSLLNSLKVLLYYFFLRLSGKGKVIE
jgi:dolichol-phosphate mannosyltransferase